MGMLVNSFRTSVNLFAPSDLSSIKAWYVGDDVTGVDGAVKAAWTDRQGAANGSGGNASSPTLSLAVVNGHNALNFASSATTQALSIGSTLLVGETAGAFFMVFKRVADPPATGRGGGVFDGFTNDVSGSRNSHHPYEDGVIYEHFGSTTRQTVGNPTPSLASWRIYSAHTGSADFRAYLDGTSLFSTGTNTVNFGSGITKYIGRSANSSDVYAGLVAEIVVFNAVLTTSDRQKVEGYLAWKYGLQAQLPVGHPYLSAAP